MKPTNVNSLQNSLQKLPYPKFRGELLKVRLRDRISELNHDAPVEGQIEAITNSERTILLEATELAKNGDRWFEWQIIGM